MWQLASADWHLLPLLSLQFDEIQVDEFDQSLLYETLYQRQTSYKACQGFLQDTELC